MHDASDASQHTHVELKTKSPVQTRLKSKMFFPSPALRCTSGGMRNDAEKTNERTRIKTNVTQEIKEWLS